MLISAIQTHTAFQQLNSSDTHFNKMGEDQRPPLALKRKLSAENVTSIFPKPYHVYSGENNNNGADNDNSANRDPSGEKRPRFSINDLLSAERLTNNCNDIASTSNESICDSKTTPVNDNLSTVIVNSISKLKDEQHQKAVKSPAKGNPSTSKRIVRPENIVVPPNYTPNGNSPRLANIRCTLEPENHLLWTRFNKIGTEMIITKPGRRMFPTMKIRLENCDVDANYYVYLDAIPVDAKRYRYVYSKSAWCCSGKADRTPPNRLYVHPDSPFSGAQMQLHTISFEKAKLTNNETDNRGHLVLNSMHKYQPRIHILRRDRALPPLDNGGQGADLCAPAFRDNYRTFHFGETQFMAVTAYQNQLVTEMKIAMNPFAKGFRDHGNRVDSGNDFMDVMGGSSSQMNLCGVSLPYPLDSRKAAISATRSSSGVELSAKPQQYGNGTAGLADAYTAQLAYAQALNALFPNYFRSRDSTVTVPTSMTAVTNSTPKIGPQEMAILAATWQEHLTKQRANSFFKQQQQQQEQQENMSGGTITSTNGSGENFCEPVPNELGTEQNLSDTDDENEYIHVDDNESVRGSSVDSDDDINSAGNLNGTPMARHLEDETQQEIQQQEPQEMQSLRRKCLKPSRKCKQTPDENIT